MPITSINVGIEVLIMLMDSPVQYMVAIVSVVAIPTTASGKTTPSHDRNTKNSTRPSSATEQTVNTFRSRTILSEYNHCATGIPVR